MPGRQPDLESERKTIILKDHFNLAVKWSHLYP